MAYGAKINRAIAEISCGHFSVFENKLFGGSSTTASWHTPGLTKSKTHWPNSERGKWIAPESP
jgi:hypothetical protein